MSRRLAACCSMLIAFAATAPARAAVMTPVAKNEGYCAHDDQNAICHEWKLVADARVRLVAWGFEDGVEVVFYRRVAGHYTKPLRVLPVLRDTARPGQDFWAYPRDMADLAEAGGGLRVLATFDHGLDDDSNVDTPKGQLRLPAVLFVGTTTQPPLETPRPPFAAIDLTTLRRRARAH